MHNDVRQLKSSQTSKLCLFSEASECRPGCSLSQTGQILVCYFYVFQDFVNLLMDTSSISILLLSVPGSMFYRVAWNDLYVLYEYEFRKIKGANKC